MTDKPDQTGQISDEPAATPVPGVTDNRQEDRPSADEILRTLGIASPGGFSAGDPGETGFTARVLDEELRCFASDPFLAANRDVLKRLIGSGKSPLYWEAATFVLDSIRRADQGQPIDFEQGMGIGLRLLTGVAETPDLLLAATDRLQEFSVTGHSVNVAILAARLSQTLNYQVEQRERVTLAALLHEVGVVLLPRKLVHKEEEISERELAFMRERPMLSSQLLRELGCRDTRLIETVQQFFERENGRGFPRGLAGAQVLEEAKLLGLADFFEACTHNRPYRRALTGYQTIYELTTRGAGAFPDYLMKSLIKTLSLFPYNERVVLNTGEVGIVIDIRPESLSRPVVRIIGADPAKVAPRVLDLTENPSLSIVRSVPADAVSTDGQQYGRSEQGARKDA